MKTESFPASPERPVINQLPVKNSKLLILLILLVIVLTTFIGVTIGYLLGSSKNQVAVYVPITSPSTVISSPSPTSTPDPTANWKTYTNTKYGYEFKYPSIFNLVKGSASDQTDEYFKELSSISFSGMQKSSDQNAGVVFSITVDPTNSEGQPMVCSTNNECLQKWMKVLNSTTNQVSYINILNQRIQGFEYQIANKLYQQNNSYYVFLKKGKVWLISLTANNYTSQETTPVFDQILSTFKFLQ